MKNILIAGLVALNLTAPTTVTKVNKEIKTPYVTINKEESLQENIKRNIKEQGIGILTVEINSLGVDSSKYYPDGTIDTIDLSYIDKDFYLNEEYLYILVNTTLRTANLINNSIDQVCLNGYPLYSGGSYHISNYLKSNKIYDIYN